MIKIFPSLIASNVLQLEKTVLELQPYCSGFHIDVMDWHFVPNLTMGPLFINPLAKLSEKPLLVHLMIENIKPFLSMLQLRTIDTVSIHIESKEEINSLINCVKENKWRAGLAISPKTPLEKIFPFLPHIDHILLMSVMPGFSGQEFIESTYTRAEQLVSYLKSNKLRCVVGVDGGINESMIQRLYGLGIEEITMGAGIFDKQDPKIWLQNFNNSYR